VPVVDQLTKVWEHPVVKRRFYEQHPHEEQLVHDAQKPNELPRSLKPIKQALAYIWQCNLRSANVQLDL
jgi:hypothetical protein